VLFLHSLDPNVYLMLKPASREYVSEIFHLLKSDDDDTLNREEFAVVMKILYSQVLTRIVIQWTLTLMSESCELILLLLSLAIPLTPDCLDA
jgi:hypothetical protein